MRPVVLSRRLQTVASMVTQGSRVCDVGCDHGFVSIYLIEQRVSPYVLAMDVREGPLGAAWEHVSERGLESSIEIRLSDGLHNYEIGEAESLICAGMGGRLMMRILEADKTKTDSFRELILQPQSELEQFRAWLREQGYHISDERMVEEDGKFYPMMRVVTHCKNVTSDLWSVGDLYDASCVERFVFHVEPSSGVRTDQLDRTVLCKLFDRYGGLLLINRDGTLKAYLKREELIYEEILNRLMEQGLSDGRRRERYAGVEALLQECRMALKIIEADG